MGSIEVVKLNTDKKITIFIKSIIWVSETNDENYCRILVSNENPFTVETSYLEVLKMIKEAKD